MRVLGLDYGTKRIGVAVSDELGFTSQGLATIARSTKARDIEAVRELAARYACETIVVGLPRNMDGSYGGAAGSARRFAGAVARGLGICVELVDERMTTLIANRALLEAGESRAGRRQLVDRLSAQVILQGYLESIRQKQENGCPGAHCPSGERVGPEAGGENKRA